MATARSQGRVRWGELGQVYIHDYSFYNVNENLFLKY